MFPSYRRDHPTDKEETERLLDEGGAHPIDRSPAIRSWFRVYLAVFLTILCIGLPPLLVAVLLPSVALRGKDWLAGRVRPFFINVEELLNGDMPFNMTLEPCDIPLAFTTDKNAASIFITNIYSEMRTHVDHSVQHWQPTVFYNLEGGSQAPVFDGYNHSNGLRSYYDFRWTYEFDAPVTSTYYQFSKFKDLRAAPVPFKDKMQVPVAVDLASVCHHRLSNRFNIVKELHRLLPGRVYSYGSCNHNRNLQDDFDNLGPTDRGSPNWQKAKFEMLRYSKFYLAFENSHVVDYVSEKYWDALTAGAVPVYLGAPNLREHFLPHPKAAIIASEFETVQDLADRLEYLAGNETAYNEYLEWKTLPYSDNFQAIVDYEDSAPPLCRIAQYTRGEFKNPLNAFKTSEKYGGVQVTTPRIT